MILGIETSCDETSVAVVENGRILVNLVASQVQLHAEYGGVVPELATREHHRNLVPLVRSALRTAGINPIHLAGVAVTRGPGLPAALLAGYTAAQSLAYALHVPLIGVHHHQAHLYSPFICGQPPKIEWDQIPPHVALIVSGGHTLLVSVSTGLRHEVLGGTLDDAAGECFDKTAKLLGLPYPGGPILDRLAREGRPDAHSFPRPRMTDPDDDFSFSGLKTSVRYWLEKHPHAPDDVQGLRDLCASIQAAIVEVLAVKTVRAARRLGLNLVAASGGVSCNSGLRQELERRCHRHKIRLQIAEPTLCTDNAGMVAVLGERLLQTGHPADPLDAGTFPSWPLEMAENRRDDIEESNFPKNLLH